MREQGANAAAARQKNFTVCDKFCIAMDFVAVHKDQAIMAILPKDRLYGPEHCSGPFFLGMRDYCGFVTA